MITAYPCTGKTKSLNICRAFMDGCGGAVATGVSTLLDGDAFFYGVDVSNLHLYRQIRKDRSRSWYYCDNAYFDETRGTHFRVTRNRLQHTGLGFSNGVRFKALRIPIQPWKENGEHVLVCPQSEDFMRTVVEFNGNWAMETYKALSSITKRNIRLRMWNRDKIRLSATLAVDLMDAHVLVTWSSAAAVTALLAGVPVVIGSADCAAMPMSGQLFDLENPKRPDRTIWAGVLADNQWTLDEFRDGTAWKALNVG